MREPMGELILHTQSESPVTRLTCIKNGLWGGTDLLGDVITAVNDFAELTGKYNYSGSGEDYFKMNDSRVYLWNVLSRLEVYGIEAEQKESNVHAVAPEVNQ